MSLRPTQPVWRDLRDRAQAIVNRLTAVAGQLELLAERTRDRQMQIELESVRGDVAAAARDAREIGDAVASRSPRPETHDLAALVTDTTAPLHRWLVRRETELDVGELRHGASVALEPEVVRSAIAAAIDALLGAARAGETLRIRQASRAEAECLRFDLATRGVPPGAEALRGALSSTAAMLELRGGAARVETSASTASIVLELPSHPAERR